MESRLINSAGQFIDRIRLSGKQIVCFSLLITMLLPSFHRCNSLMLTRNFTESREMCSQSKTYQINSFLLKNISMQGVGLELRDMNVLLVSSFPFFGQCFACQIVTVNYLLALEKANLEYNHK